MVCASSTVSAFKSSDIREFASVAVVAVGGFDCSIGVVTGGAGAAAAVVAGGRVLASSAVLAARTGIVAAGTTFFRATGKSCRVGMSARRARVASVGTGGCGALELARGADGAIAGAGIALVLAIGAHRTGGDGVASGVESAHGAGRHAVSGSAGGSQGSVEVLASDDCGARTRGAGLLPVASRGTGTTGSARNEAGATPAGTVRDRIETANGALFAGVRVLVRAGRDVLARGADVAVGGGVMTAVRGDVTCGAILAARSSSLRVVQSRLAGTAHAGSNRGKFTVRAAGAVASAV